VRTKTATWMLVVFILGILAASGYESVVIIAGDPPIPCHPSGIAISADLQLVADDNDNPCPTTGMVTP
jgi:hypothetical protein